MPDFTRISHRLHPRGVNLSRPPDSLPPDDYPLLENVRLLQGSPVARPGQYSLYPTQTPSAISVVHSIRRLNDPIGGGFTRFLGIDSKLYSQTAAANPVEIDASYSGDPLSMVRYRPDQSVESWMYIADRLKMRKSSVSLSPTTVRNIGIAPPTSPPSVDVDTQAYFLLALFDAAAPWSGTGIAGVPTAPTRTSTTVAQILYDVGTAGLCVISPATTDNAWLQPGAMIGLGAVPETVIVSEVHPAVKTTTIAAIAYDAGVTGLCTIVLASSTADLARNSLLYLSSTEYVRVLSVNLGPDGLYSFRCSTALTHVATGSVVGLDAFRSHTVATFAPAATLVAWSVRSTLTGSGIGTIQRDVTTDLSSFSDGNPLTSDDYIHISLKADLPANIVEVRLLIDVDASTNNFLENYYERRFLPSDFSTAGDNGWRELYFRVGGMTRVGTDSTRTLADVKKIGIEITVSATTIIDCSSWWLGGGHGPDVLPGSPVGIYYRYRYRDSRTGARSVPGPATRYGIFPLRQRILVGGLVNSSDAQVDVIDVERLDPLLQSPAPAAAKWTYVGTVSSAVASLADDLIALSIAANPALETNVLQPFPILVPPISGTVTVTGTTVVRTAGDNFPTDLVAGTVILINDTAYQTYGQPTSASRLELAESAGAQTAVSYRIGSPLRVGRPLPVLFGALEGPTAGFMFALGDTSNPGNLYWTNGNDPDSAADTNFIEVSSPSDPLIGGAVWQTYVFVATRDRWWLIQPTFDQPNLFTPLQLPSPSGLWSRWGWAAGIDGVYFWGRDGFYRLTPYEGAKYISGDLWPLFPHDGQPGVTVNGYIPPDMTVLARLRVSVGDGDVYFDYQDINSNLRTFRYVPPSPASPAPDEEGLGGYFPHIYAHPVTLHYWEEIPDTSTSSTLLLLECTNNGRVMQSGGTQDLISTITCRAQTPYLNQGDARPNKLYSDQWFILNSAGSNSGFTITLLGNIGKRAITLKPATVVGVNDLLRGNYLLDINSGLGTLADNISLLISWTAALGDTTIAPTQTPIEWQCSFVPKPPDTALQATDWTDDGLMGAKWVMALVIEADTTDPDGVVQTRTVQLQHDGGTNGAPVTAATLTIIHAGQSEIPYAVSTPFVGHNLRLAPTDARVWRLFRVRYIWVPYPELTTAATPWTDDGDPAAKFLQGVVLVADSAGVAAPLTVQGDAGIIVSTPTANHNGQDAQAYSWPPVATHLMRIVPGSINIRIWAERIKWIWVPYPELAVQYTTHGLTHNLRGLGQGLDATIHYQSLRTVTLTITTELGTENYLLPSTDSVAAGGAENRAYFRLRRQKGRLWTWSCTSGLGFRLFGDSIIRVKEWGGQVQQLRPIGLPVAEGSMAKI